MKKSKILSVVTLLAIAFVVDAQGGCPTKDPTMCEPNNGWADGGPFYHCGGDNGTCCWTKEGDVWCWTNGAWTKTPFMWRFAAYNSYCPTVTNEFANCVSLTGTGGGGS